MSKGGLYRTTACSSVMPLSLFSEDNDMEQAKLKRQSGLEVDMSVRITCHSLDWLSRRRTATGFSSVTVELDIVILLLISFLLASLILLNYASCFHR